MPPTTSVRTFIRALQTGRTKITKALDVICADPSVLAEHDHWEDFSGNSGELNGAMPEYVRDLLREHLSEAEVDHCSHWPDEQKEVVRQALVDAVNGELPARFEWELHSGASSVSSSVTGAEAVVVTFKSPRAGLGLVATSTTENYDVNVDIEPSGNLT